MSIKKKNQMVIALGAKDQEPQNNESTRKGINLKNVSSFKFHIYVLINCTGVSL